MKKVTALICFLTLSLISCSVIDKECLCTMEYRYYLVTVVDTLGAPVDSLTVTIKDEEGKILNVEQELHPYGAGKYTVLSDSVLQVFCICGTVQKIFFSATDGTRNASGEFQFNTDDCKCHVYKVAGADTLLLK